MSARTIKEIANDLDKFRRINSEDIQTVIDALRPTLPTRIDETTSGESPLPNGCVLFWKLDVMGNRSYFSDEIGGGVHVWDVTLLVDHSTLLAALTKEWELKTVERHLQEKRLCGSRGMAGGRGCFLPKGHEGDHKY